jgi:hypothetical protein
MPTDYGRGNKRGGDTTDASLKRQRTTATERSRVRKATTPYLNVTFLYLTWMPLQVVFVRGLPSDCLESELLALCCPFAVVEKCLLIPPMNQAFVQLPDVASATNLITFYQSRDAMIRGKKIFFEYSTRDEITRREDVANGQPPQQQQTSSHHGAAPGYQQHQAPVASMQSQYQQQQPPPYAYAQPPQGAVVAPVQAVAAVTPAHAILMVTVTKIEYDVTADVLQQVFQKFGNVQKVVTFWTNSEFKSLIQMETIAQAQAAQAALHGRDIYTGCNTLHVVFSRHQQLHVRFNNERSRDYMNPNLPAGPAAGDPYGADPGFDVEPPENFGLPQPVVPATGPPVAYQQQPPPRYAGEDPYRPDPRGPPPGGRPDFDSRGPPPREYDPRGPPPSNGRSDYDYPPDHGRDSRDRGRDQDRDRDHDRDIRGGRDNGALGTRTLPPHSTGRAIRTHDHQSPVLICSNMDSRLVVSGWFSFAFRG